jgi:DHA2 family methylenomycin A resistance protein-like MFS transporter
MMEAVPADRAGPAAGVLDSARQVAGGPAIAAFGSSVSGGFESGTRVSLALSAVLLTATAAATLGPRGTG